MTHNNEWITVKGNHIKLKEGESKEDAARRFIKEKSESNKVQGEKIKGYETVTEKDAVKFIASPFEISKDRKETINNFKIWYRDNLQGKSVNNPLLGEVLFSYRGMNETKHQNLSNLDNLKFISVVPEIIKSSKDIVKEDLKHYKQGVKCAYRVKGFVDENDNKRKLSIIVLKNQNGKHFYTFDAREFYEQIPPVKTGGGQKTLNELISYQNINVNNLKVINKITFTDWVNPNNKIIINVLEDTNDKYFYKFNTAK